MGFPFKKGKKAGSKRVAQAAAVEGKGAYSFAGRDKKVGKAGPESPPFMKKGG